MHEAHLDLTRVGSGRVIKDGISELENFPSRNVCYLVTLITVLKLADIHVHFLFVNMLLLPFIKTAMRLTEMHVHI